MTANDPLTEQELDAVENILSYWFGHKNLILPATPVAKKRWFSGTDSVDNEIRQQFEHWVERALEEELGHWTQTPESHLALILLLDQFTRNIYRHSAKAFAGDALALQYAHEALSRNITSHLGLQQQVFVVTPLEHAENLDDQQRCLDFVSSLIEQTDDQHPLMTYLQNTMRFVRQHHDLIETYGRFPHRNRILDRDSTEQEIAYLNDKPSSFGQ